MNINNTLCLFLCFLLFFSTLFSPSLSKNCNPSDKKVLLQIKKALNNPYLLASWDPKTDCCDWYCLECHPTTHRVIALTMFSDDKLTGQIPPQVGDLPYLETLLFRHLPNLNGTIPPTITKLKNLNTIRLSWTNLSGPVPEFLSQMNNLTYLDLSFNNFSGPIPSSLARLPNLGTLHLDRNKLTGSIPESFGRFAAKDMYLYLSHNKLSGAIPASFANADYTRVDLSRNMLEGDASMLFGPNKTTWEIDISRNMFQFDLSKVEFPKSLARLDLNHNKIMGSLPQGLRGLEDLQFMNVSYNRLCGQIPVGGRLQSFDYSTYFHNRCLCGAPLPSCK